MALNERQKKILKSMQEERAVYVPDIASKFGVTEASIRLDLNDLENRGYIKRFHGGAKLVKPSAYEERIKVNQQVKRTIAKRALQYISPGDTLFLDSGTTVLMLAQLLIGVDKLTIVTNSIPIAQQVGREYEKEVILAGGFFNYSEQCCEGPMSEKFLNDFRASTAFIGADSAAPSSGLFSNGVRMVGYVQKIIDNSERTVLLIDSSKFRTVGTIRFGDIDCVDFIITDSGIPEEIRDGLLNSGVQLVIV